jgi:hypothetical protein
MSRQGNQHQTIIELSRAGDDGLTKGFTERLEGDLRSAGFAIAEAGQPRTPQTLIVRIPFSLRWERVGGRTQATYTVEFSGPNGEVLGTSTGSCWDDELDTCAAKAVLDAQAASQKHRERER